MHPHREAELSKMTLTTFLRHQSFISFVPVATDGQLYFQMDDLRGLKAGKEEMSLCKKNLFILIILTSSLVSVFSISRAEIGGFVGGSYYLGDLNPTGVFKSPRYSLAAVYRFNINPRYVIKVPASWIALSATDNNITHIWLHTQTFSVNVIDISPQFEFNFLPLKFAEGKKYFTTYVSSGIGFMTAFGSQTSSKVNIPMALGCRLTLGKAYSVGLEWNLRKLFSDNLDKQLNIGSNGSSSLFHNNDWYYFVGAFFSVRLFSNEIDCPAYK